MPDDEDVSGVATTRWPLQWRGRSNLLFERAGPDFAAGGYERFELLATLSVLLPLQSTD